MYLGGDILSESSAKRTFFDYYNNPRNFCPVCDDFRQDLFCTTCGTPNRNCNQKEFFRRLSVNSVEEAEFLCSGSNGDPGWHTYDPEFPESKYCPICGYEKDRFRV